MKEENFDKVGADNPLQSMKDFAAQLMNLINGYHQALAENEQLRQQAAKLRQRVAKLESENAAFAETIEQWKKDDEWASRVTYEGVVEQIAACEDAKERDEARKLIEPLLKRSQVTQFRRDIKKRVKELNEESAGTFNNYGTYTEVHAGGINISNKKDAGH
jgi:regulator of replication initiation timing